MTMSDLFHIISGYRNKSELSGKNYIVIDLISGIGDKFWKFLAKLNFGEKFPKNLIGRQRHLGQFHWTPAAGEILLLIKGGST